MTLDINALKIFIAVDNSSNKKKPFFNELSILWI